jgi:hypothetical protein
MPVPQASMIKSRRTDGTERRTTRRSSSIPYVSTPSRGNLRRADLVSLGLGRGLDWGWNKGSGKRRFSSGLGSHPPWSGRCSDHGTARQLSSIRSDLGAYIPFSASFAFRSIQIPISFSSFTQIRAHWEPSAEGKRAAPCTRTDCQLFEREDST